MPLGPGVRYRVKTTKSGKKVRLAFKGNRVVEAKGPGGTHTESEFRAERRKRARATRTSRLRRVRSA